VPVLNEVLRNNEDLHLINNTIKTITQDYKTEKKIGKCLNELKECEDIFLIQSGLHLYGLDYALQVLPSKSDSHE